MPGVVHYTCMNCFMFVSRVAVDANFELWPFSMSSDTRHSRTHWHRNEPKLIYENVFDGPKLVSIIALGAIE